LQRDKDRKTGSYIIGAIGYTLGAAVLVAVIIAALKSSCPFVSAYDGNQFIVQGEIYGGAIYPQLARYDFLPLKMKPVSDNQLQIKISNELKERQYTDIADLLIITHDKNSKVLADEAGNLYSISHPETPVSAILNGRKEVCQPLQSSGDFNLLYMDDTSQNARDEVVIKFNKPDSVKNGKLVLCLKNSYWLDLLYGELIKGFGNYYNTYLRKQRNKQASELLKWVSDQ